jgi:hypothetical protein
MRLQPAAQIDFLEKIELVIGDDGCELENLIESGF